MSKDLQRTQVIRIAPVCRGKIYLVQQPAGSNGADSGEVWDLPIKQSCKGSFAECEAYATRLVHSYNHTIVSPRLILKYRASFPCALASQQVLLYILPLDDRSDFPPSEGRFFDFDEIAAGKEHFNCCLLHEQEQLRVAAKVWNDFNPAKP